MSEVVIAGAGIHKFGRFGDKPYVQIGEEAVRMALSDAGMKWTDIQAMFCASMYMPPTTGVRILERFGRTGIPVVDVEAACAGGGACLKQAYSAVASGAYDVVLAMGVEKMPRGFMAPEAIYNSWQCRLGLSQNPLYWALNARRHMHDYGTTEQQIAKVAVKNHRNSTLNPNAMYQKAIDLEEIMLSPMVCDPMRLLMLCAPDEGAAAAIVCTREVAKRFKCEPVTLAAVAHRTAPFPLNQVASFCTTPTGKPPVTTLAAQEAYKMAGLGPEDQDIVELQDTDAFCEIEAYEHLGLCRPGEGGCLIDEGVTERTGRLPVNVSGGLISKGEPVGASALGQVFELVTQLRGRAGPRQISGVKVGLSHVFGAHGHSAVTIVKK